MTTVPFRRCDGADVVPLDYTVLHLTDRKGSHRPVVLNRHRFHSHEEAADFARRQSEGYPAPQRFAVYSPVNDWLGSWQLGRSVPILMAAA